MAVLVKTKLNLSDPDTLRELAFLTGNADYSFVAENLLNRIAEENKAEEFGEYFRAELGKPDSTFRDCFDKEKFFNIWRFFSEIDKRAKEICTVLSLPASL